MAPVNNDRHPSHTGTIPKTKARNNCNVPQEAVTPTRRDMTTNLVSVSFVSGTKWNIIHFINDQLLLKLPIRVFSNINYTRVENVIIPNSCSLKIY